MKLVECVNGNPCSSIVLYPTVHCDDGGVMAMKGMPDYTYAAVEE